MKIAALRKSRLSVAMAIIGSSITAPSLSSANEVKNVMLEEVIVTAQKRAQNLQDVPVAISSFNALELENMGVTNIIELEKSVPNAQFRASRATNSTLTAYIRGVGQQDPLWGFEPGVGVYVDDVYYARPQAAVMEVFDVERIEVLRGPQGTLYGKNTVGGAIKYVTRELTGETEGEVKLTGGDYGQQEILLSGQMPLIADTLYVGAAVSKMERDGYGEVSTGYDINTATYSNEVENYNKDLEVGRVTIEYTPTDKLFFRLAGDKTKDKSNQPCGTQSSQTTLTHPATGELFLASGKPYDSTCGTTHKSHVKNKGYSLTARYDISDDMSLKYIFADRDGETKQFIDFEATPLDSFDVPAHYTDHQKSHELQLNYSAERFAVVAGLYYFSGNAAGAFDVALNETPYMDGSLFDLGIRGDVDTTSESAYLNVNYNVTDAITLTAGVRTTRDKKKSNIQRFSFFTFNSFPYTTTQGSEFTYGDPADDTLLGISTNISANDAKDSWTETSPTAKADWKITENVMVYVSYAEGFKSGGFDMRGNASLNPNVADGYDPETVETWEAGIKSELLDSRLRLNFTVFDMDYDDMQLTVQQAQPAPIFFSSDVLNAGSSSISGFELEGMGQITENLSTTLVVGYLDADLNEVISGGVNVADTWEMLNAPKWTGQIGFNYNWQLDDAGSLALNTALSYRDSSRNFNNTTCTCDQDESYTLWDASVNWYSPDEHWKVGLYLKNINDEEYKTGGYNLGSGELAFYGPPRVWTANVSYQF